MVMNKVNFEFLPKEFDQETQNCVKTSYAKFINFFEHYGMIVTLNIVEFEQYWMIFYP